MARTSSVREEIVARSLDLFAHHGFEATSLQDIASAVGCTKATVLYHFKDKAGVFNEAVRPTVELLTALNDRLQAEPLETRTVRGIEELVSLAVRARTLIAVLSPTFPAPEDRANPDPLVAQGVRLLGLLADPADPRTAGLASFALLGVTAYCRGSEHLSDAALEQTLRTALAQLLLASPPG